MTGVQTCALPIFPQAHSNLGNALSDTGRLDEAIAECREAIRLKKDFALAHYNLGGALMDKGQLDEAIAEYREAIRLKKDFAEAHLTLGLTLQRQGRFAQALAALRFFTEAFAARPALAEDVKAGHRYNAACVAALAVSGQSQDKPPLSEESRARWRQQALSWLRADLAVWTEQLRNGKPEAQAEVRKTLEHWQRDPDLAGLREEAALAKLPEAERKACRDLWAEVHQLLKRAHGHE